MNLSQGNRQPPRQKDVATSPESSECSAPDGAMTPDAGSHPGAEVTIESKATDGRDPPKSVLLASWGRLQRLRKERAFITNRCPVPCVPFIANRSSTTWGAAA